MTGPASSPAAIPDRQPASQVKASRQFVGFRLDDQEYAFRIEEIQEILIPDRVARMPQVADFVEGVSNLRGTIIPIINLRRLFSMTSKDRDLETRTVVVNVAEKIIGCTVDAVTQVIRVTPDQILPAPDIIRSSEAVFISGFVKLDSRLITVLEISELLDPAKMEQVRDVAARGLTFQASQ